MKIIGITWALLLVGISLGYILGYAIADIISESQCKSFGMVFPIFALLWVFGRLKCADDVPSSGDASSGGQSKEKEKSK